MQANQWFKQACLFKNLYTYELMLSNKWNNKELLFIGNNIIFKCFTYIMFLLQFSAASITVFLSWFELLLLLQRFDQIGIYVVMFLEILQTLIKVLMLFSILIIAFGLAFFILLSKVGCIQIVICISQYQFSDVGQALRSWRHEKLAQRFKGWLLDFCRAMVVFKKSTTICV